MKYLVVSFSDPSKLSKEVNILIEKGWKPHGGISVSTSNFEYENQREGCKELAFDTIFAQAMIHD